MQLVIGIRYVILEEAQVRVCHGMHQEGEEHLNQPMLADQRSACCPILCLSDGINRKERRYCSGAYGASKKIFQVPIIPHTCIPVVTFPWCAVPAMHSCPMVSVSVSLSFGFME